MFTGIVEEMGTLLKKQNGARSAVITVKADKVLENTNLGDSIAVNGICLTVTSLNKNSFDADVMSETMNKSTIGTLMLGDKVNLERAMAADGRFGGHIVSGHIDGTGTVQSITKDDNAVWFEIKADEKILRYIVEKGSITIDGISLTVAYVDDTVFKVSIIPHTMEVTILGNKKKGSLVNLECDLIGKYVEKLMFSRESSEIDKKSSLSESFLMENGFI